MSKKQQKTLREFLKEKKDYYVSSLSHKLSELAQDYVSHLYRASEISSLYTLEKALESGDISLSISIAGKSLERAVESGASSSAGEISKGEDRDSKKEKLTYEVYSKLKNEGCSDESIRREYMVENEKSFAGFVGSYNRWNAHRKKKGSKKKGKEDVAIDKRPSLTRYRYCKSRDEGLSHEQIREKYYVKNPRSLSGFASYYSLQVSIRKKRVKRKEKKDE